MAFQFLLLLFLLLVVFLLSKAFIKNLYLLFCLITRSKFWAIQLTTLILLPGTIIHELSHLIAAEVLRVPTGDISFTPEIIKKNGEIKAGSLKIASVDPFRRTLVGLAPLLTGLTAITLISKLYLIKYFPLFNLQQWSNGAIEQWLMLLVTCYLLLVISNTMFSSKKDLEAAALPAIILFMVIGAFYLGGFPIYIKPQTQETLKNILMAINSALALTIAIDLIFLGIVKVFFNTFTKIFKRKVIKLSMMS